jgi:hypothetical protein
VEVFFFLPNEKKTFAERRKKGRECVSEEVNESFFPTSSAAMATHERDEKSPNAVVSDGM